MTAWLAVVAPICLGAKCCVDFIALEYGSKFQFVSDKHLLIACICACAYAFFVDVVNFLRKVGRE